MAIAIRGTTPATAIDPGTSATVSLTLTGTRQPQAGDLLVILHCNDYYAATNMPTPTVGGSTTGVNAVTGGSVDAGANEAHIKAYTYVAGSTGDLTVSVTETGTHDEEKALVVYVLSGADTTTPVDGTVGSATDAVGTTTPWAVGAATPSTASAFLIGHVNSGAGSTAGASVTAPGTMTQQYNLNNGGLTMCGGTEQLAASGSTGTRTFTPALAAPWAGILVPVKTGTGAAASIPYGAQRMPQGRDPGAAWWLQRDRSNANLVATAANPLPMPLAVANGDDVQRSAARWPLPFAAGAVYGQRDRRNAVLIGSGPVAADPLTLPDGAARQRIVADFTDRRLAPVQRPYVSDPAMLSTALLENELLGDSTTDMRARTPGTHGDRRETVPQRSYVDPALTQPSLLENELLGGATTFARSLTPATHADRRQTVPPRPPVADQSTAAAASFDPTLAGSRVAQSMPATHTDRRLVPAQRVVQSAPDDVVIVGTGALGAWWGAEEAVGYLAATLPRPTVPQDAATAPFDPTLAGLVDWLLNEPATHWRAVAPLQRPVFADPTLQPQSDPTLFAAGPARAALTWPTDRRQVPQQRPYVSDPSTYPTVAPTDPLTVAWGAGGTYWLIYNTAALTVDRREVPQQRRYVSDPATLATALLENELLGGATAGLRRFTPATHGDRRQVPWQRPVFVQLLPPVPADPTLLGYLVARIARTWPTPDGRTWRPQQRAVLYAYGATPPYVRPGRLAVAVRTVGYFTQAAAPTGTITTTARSTAALHPDT